MAYRKWFRILWVILLFGGYCNAQEMVLKQARLLFVDNETFSNRTIYGFEYTADTTMYFISSNQDIDLSDSCKKLIVGQKYTLTYYRIVGPIRLKPNGGNYNTGFLYYKKSNGQQQVFSYCCNVFVDLFYSSNLFADYYVNDFE